jgi:hypothetical protein
VPIELQGAITMKRRMNWSSGIAFVTIGMAACGAPPGDQQPSSESPLADVSWERLQTLDQDLVIGSSGEDVRAVHGYLATFGYLPNEKLAHEYPAWRPLVPTRPADAAVYDEHTAVAVRHLQQISHVEVTGIVDAPTRAVLRMPRCGFPEGMPALDPTDKFSLANPANFGVGPDPRWWLEGEDPAMKASIQNAIAAWSAVTTVNFVNAPNALSIYFRYAPLPSPLLAQTTPKSGGTMTITMNSNLNWYKGLIPIVPAGQYDFWTVVEHEIGHAMGLNHSSWGDATTEAVMATYTGTTAGTSKRNLDPDDKVAVSVLHDTVTQITSGIAIDIGASPVVNGAVWALGTDDTIWKWDGGNGWIHEVANGVAKRIAVDGTGIPWVAAPWGIYRRTSADPNQGTWEQRNGACALDVGVGTVSPTDPSPVVWMVGCNGYVYKFGGLWWDLDNSWPNPTATRIAVDRLGTPWVIGASQVVYHRSSADIAGGAYANLPGGSFDIGVSKFPLAWGVSVFQVANGYQMWAFDYQNAAPGAPAEWTWKQFGLNGATNITVGPSGEPWWTDLQGRIFRTLR